MNKITTLARWQSVWQQLGGRDSGELFHRLVACYAEPHRKYHTMQHLEEWFDEYEVQVRQEYSWVPGFLYRRERRKVLKQFASRPTIYNTEYFRAEYETTARENLARSLARL